MLIGGRFIQGVGGALASAVILGMIVTMFPEPREQAKAIGVYGFVASAGGSIGLLAGGVPDPGDQLALDLPHQPADRDRDRDRRPAAGRGRPGHRPRRGRRHARRGADHRLADDRRLHDPRRRRARLGLGADARLLGALSLALLRRLRLPPGADRQPADAAAACSARATSPARTRSRRCSSPGMFGMFFLGALYLQRVLGYDALEVGLAFLPATIVMGTMSLGFSEKLIMRFGPRTTLIPGVAMIGVGLLLFARTPVDGNYLADLLPPMVLIGLGVGTSLPLADDAGDVGRDAERRRAGLGPRQHQHAGRRRDRPRRAGDAGGRAHRRPLADGASHLAALNSGYHLAYLVGAGAGGRRPRRSRVFVLRSPLPPPGRDGAGEAGQSRPITEAA